MEAKEYKITIPAHPSIYDPKPREMDVYFCEPGAGVNEETGLLLLIPGFGAHAESRVYKKMRKIFADKYNLVTIQCNYFGHRFMQDPRDVLFNLNLQVLKSIFSEDELTRVISSGSVDFGRLLEIGQKYDALIRGKAVIDESAADFNDMGVMQALDCLAALLVVVEILKDNGYDFHRGRIITYGHSHGSYLAYLCNAFCPGLINFMIDNSGWLLPGYLKSDRVVTAQKGKLRLETVFSYLARAMGVDLEIRSLDFLYRGFANRSCIVCYQGAGDMLIKPIEKRRFAESIKGVTYIEVEDSMIDGKKFGSTGHGLDADFLELMEYSLSLAHEFEKRPEIPLDDVYIETSMARYLFSYGNGVPVLSVSPN